MPITADTVGNGAGQDFQILPIFVLLMIELPMVQNEMLRGDCRQHDCLGFIRSCQPVNPQVCHG